MNTTHRMLIPEGSSRSTVDFSIIVFELCCIFCAERTVRCAFSVHLMKVLVVASHCVGCVDKHRNFFVVQCL